MVFLELRREPGVCSRVMVGVAFKKLLFVHRRQDSYLVTMYNPGIETTLSRTIRTHLDVKQETEVHVLVGTVILGFLSVFRKSQASTPFEALNSVCLSRYQSDVIPPIQMRRRTMTFLGSPQGIQTSLHVVRCNTILNLRQCREIWPSFESGSLAVHST